MFEYESAPLAEIERIVETHHQEVRKEAFEAWISANRLPTWPRYKSDDGPTPPDST